MKEFKLRFSIFGKEMSAKVKAESLREARRKIRQQVADSVVFEDSDPSVDFLKDFFGFR